MSVGGYDEGYADGKAEGMEQGFEEGVLSVPSYYAEYINFGGEVFPENYNFVMKVRKSIGINFMRSQNLKSIKLIADDTTHTINMQQIYRECATLEIVDLTEYGRKITNASYMFFQAKAIKSVYGALDVSECTSFTNWLNGAPNLEDIEFAPGTIKISIPFSWNDKLTDASVQSIIDGLADLTGQTAQTLTFTGTVGNKLTQAQKDAISAKNWTLAY